jgi:small conductance mechanosensitive channel
MIRRLVQAAQWRPVGSLSGLILGVTLIAGLLCAPAVWAAETALIPAKPSVPKAATPAPPTAAQLDALAKTIQDPAERDKLVAQLNALSAAQHAVNETDEPDLLDLLSDELSQTETNIAAILRTLPSFHMTRAWLVTQITDSSEHQRWIGILWRIGAILAGGVAVEIALRLLLGPPRAALRSRSPANRWLRLPMAILIWLVSLIPVAAFFLVSTFLMGLDALTPEQDTLLAARALIAGHALVQAALAAARALLAPDEAKARPLPIDDESANYLAIWMKRLILTGIWGYFLIRALWMLGLPHGGYEALLKVLGLVISIMLVILVLQNRQTVADRIRRRPARPGLRSTSLTYLRNYLARIWHLPAMAYILGGYIVWALQIEGGFAYLVRGSLLTILIVIIGRVASQSARQTIDRAFAVSTELRGKYPHLESRANRYLQLIHSLTQGLVGLIVILALLQMWGLGTLAFLTGELGRRMVSTILTIIVVIVATLVIWEMIGAAVERAIARAETAASPGIRRARARTVLPLVRHLLTIVLAVIAGMIVLSELGLDIAPMLAGAGIVGVAIGFGAQKLVQEIITGAMMLFDDTMAVGDVVQIGPLTGIVESLTIRAVKLRDNSGALHTIPFSAVTTISNMTRDYSYYQFNIGVAYKEDVDRVIATIRDVAEGMRAEPEWSGVITDAVDMWGVDKFADQSVVIAGRIKTLPIKQWPVGREFNRRIKQRFGELGIVNINPSSATLYFGDTAQAEALADRLRAETPQSGARTPEST